MDSKFNNSECWKSMETKLLEAYQNNKNIIVHRHIDGKIGVCCYSK